MGKEKQERREGEEADEVGEARKVAEWLRRRRGGWRGMPGRPQHSLVSAAASRPKTRTGRGI